jgi:TolB-like protein/Tfp pilus assembly protein PilF
MRTCIRFDAYEVNLLAGEIYKHGTKISLRQRSFQVLAALLEHPGQVVTREELQRRLWGEEVFVDFDNNLNAAIGRLREALGDSADHPRFIETLPRRGYRFLAKVSEPPRVVEASTAKRARLLVLPFLNLSGDSTQEYFSDAITDEIITELASSVPSHLAVIARTTAMHYKGSHKNVDRIGRELSLDYVLEGGVRTSNGRIGINVQLIQVSDQAHVFAQKYETELRDIFDVQSAIAQAVAARIGVQWPVDNAGAPTAVWRVPRKPTQDLAAYDAYIRGRSLLGSWTHEGLIKAKQFFETAVARDPQFALAHDGLAEAYGWLAFNGFMRPKDGFSAAVFSALRAIEIEPGLAQTHALLGMLRTELDYNWSEVQREMALALELDPASPVVHFRYAASGLLPHGRMDEAIAEVQRALESDPLSLFMRAWLAQYFIFARQYDRTIEECQKMLSLDPSYFFSYLALGEVLCERGLFPGAISQLRKAAELSGNASLVLGYLGMTLARSGDGAGARAVLAGLYQAAAHVYIPPTSLAEIHLGLGEIDQAFTCMDQAIDERDSIIIPIKTDPVFDPLRTDARFAALLRKMNLDS